MTPTATILLLGSGELGREFVISAKRLGARVVACDSYADAPAMQVADAAEVFSMLDGDALRAAIVKHQPDLIVPEIEAIRTEILGEIEAQGQHVVVPSARATMLTMNRDAIRDVAARELGVRTSRYTYAEALEAAVAAGADIGYPCVVKPVMSSSGKGQSVVRDSADMAAAWDYAVGAMRGDRVRVIVEEFIAFDYEITLLTIRTRGRNGGEGAEVLFCPPIGHRQERGDYQESWQPTPMKAEHIAAAQDMARRVVDNLGGYGLFGVEFFVTAEEVIFSELSPRPHDTGMVTLISQHLSEFDLHARAVLGLPIPAEIVMAAPAAASAVVLADRDAEDFAVRGLADALALGDGADARVDVRVFGKPVTRPYRRMAMALATGATADEARALAAKAAALVRIDYR
jgi:phosphoribosylglycinamide formyltransferase 2